MQRLRRYFINGVVKIEFILPRYAGQLPENKIIPGLSHGKDSPTVNRKLLIGYYNFLSNLVCNSQSIAGSASPIRRVKRKSIGGRFLVRNTRFNAHQMFAETEYLVIPGIQQHNKALAL